MNTEIDVRSILPAIRVPTLILHRANDLDSDVRGSRWMASQIQNARYVELPGQDHLAFVGDSDALLDEIQEFLTGTRPAIVVDRVLGTLLFTDIVGSTERAALIGNQRWADLNQAHFKILRHEIERFRGKEVQTTGDGILAISACAGVISVPLPRPRVNVPASIRRLPASVRLPAAIHFRSAAQLG